MLVYRPHKVRNLTYANSDEDTLRLFVLFLKVDHNLYNVHCIAVCKQRGVYFLLRN